MVNLKELWIGDNVRLKKSGRIGTFEGEVNGKARVKLKDKIVLSIRSAYRKAKSIFNLWKTRKNTKLSS